MAAKRVESTPDEAHAADKRKAEALFQHAATGRKPVRAARGKLNHRPVPLDAGAQHLVHRLAPPIIGEDLDLRRAGKALRLDCGEVLGTLRPGQHGSTFGGNPLACAVARAAMRVLVEEGMIENAARQGTRFLEGLKDIRANAIREVRGRGLMLAVELHPEAGRARRYCEALQAKGILAKDTHEHTIRIAPPLVITSDQVDWALERFATTLTQDFS